MVRRPVGLLWVTLFSVLAGSGCSAGSGEITGTAGAGQSKVYPLAERKPAPAVRGELLDGGSYDLGSHLGEVVVLNFWASWCGPCRAEAAELTAVARATADQASFLGIDVRDERDKAKAFVAGHDSGYPNLFDPAGRVVLGFTDVPPTTTPATLVVDRKGRIAAVFRRTVLRDELEPVVRRVAAET